MKAPGFEGWGGGDAEGRGRAWLAALLLVALGAPALAQDAAELARAGLPSGSPRALAFAGDVALVGTERGLYRWSTAESRWVALLIGVPIDDLAGLAGEVLIAAEGELYRWTPGLEAPQRVALPPGAGVRSVAADARGRGWAAGEAGLYVRAGPGREFQEVDGAPPAPLAVRAAGARVWVSSERALWAEQDDGSFVRQLAGLTDGWWELRAAAGVSGATWLAVPDGLWRIDASGVERRPVGAALVGALPVARGLAVVATDALYCVGPGERPAALPSAGSLAGAVAAALGPLGIEVLEPGGIRSLDCPDTPGERASLAVTLPPPTQIVGLQRAMLAHLDLEPGHLRPVEARTRRRARLPEVALSLSGDMARSHEHGRDQSVNAGRINDVLDASRDRDRGSEVRLQLSWELWRDADPDALLAISKERRELIELREQILERFDRAYFELWRTRARLAAAPPGSGERVDLEVRARELGAVLDAWTGGAFSRVDAWRPPPP